MAHRVSYKKKYLECVEKSNNLSKENEELLDKIKSLESEKDKFLKNITLFKKNKNCKLIHLDKLKGIKFENFKWTYKNKSYDDLKSAIKAKEEINNG